MLTFDAQDKQPEIELKRNDGSSKILKINYIGEKQLKELDAIEKGREAAGDQWDKLLDIAFRQLSILSSNTTKKDLDGMSIMRIFELIQEMTKLAIGQRDELEKKIPVNRKERRSRSSRRVSA
jgi:hypothetical protein